jgi:hypothetical protein
MFKRSVVCLVFNNLLFFFIFCCTMFDFVVAVAFDVDIPARYCFSLI